MEVTTKLTEQKQLPPDISALPTNDSGNQIRYGNQLILHTAYFLGPEGTIGKHLGNKMNCTNCHLEAGTRLYGLNFYNTYARYPQYRGRENAILSLEDRVNNCIERPHNGVAISKESKEMKAIVAYMKWLNQNASNIPEVKNHKDLVLNLPDRPANPDRGAVIYASNCSSCHGADGQGLMNADSSSYVYPPLWGKDSYQSGSSMHRVLKSARFIKANMPHKLAMWNNPVLTDEQAIDVAAFINNDKIHKRPSKKGINTGDYPLYKMKPIDYDLGPYEDTFSQVQHKFGPYKPIIKYHKEKKLPIVF
jgi:thiosulfate dehydrogenase